MYCPIAKKRSSAEAAGDVVLGLLALGFQKDLVGATVLDHFAQLHVDREVGYPRRLLHVVRDDGNRVLGLQFVHQLFNLGR